MLKHKIKSNIKLYKICKKIIHLKNKVIIKYFPKSASKYLYRKTFNRKLDLKNPTLFNEKIMWLKLNTYYNNDLIKECVDKVKVREYVEKKVNKDILVPCINVYNNETEINWAVLPNSFVLKINTGSGYNIICKNKSELNEKDVKKILHDWLKEEYYMKFAEYQYKNVNKKILCEELIENDIRDYKFFCFDGKPKFFYISQGLSNHNNMKMGYFNINFENLNIKREGYNQITPEEIGKIDNFEQMLEIASKLSQDFPFVRVDLYDINGKIYFSELTFIPTGGLMKIEPSKYYKIWGDMLILK